MHRLAGITSLLGGQDTKDPSIELLNRLDAKLDAMRQEMKSSFAVVNLKLDVIMSQAADTYSEVLKTGIEVEEARQKLIELQRGMYALEDQTQRDIRELDRLSSGQASDLCSQMKRLGIEPNRTQVAECLLRFYQNATERARSPLYVITPTAAGDDPVNILTVRKAAIRGLDQSVEFLQAYETDELGFPDPNSDAPSANPSLWAAAANGYAQFLQTWNPSTVPIATLREQMTSLRDEGLDVRIALGRLSRKVSSSTVNSNGGQIQIPLLASLQFYQNRVSDFATAFADDSLAALREYNEQTIFKGNDPIRDRGWVTSVGYCPDLQWSPNSTNPHNRGPMNVVIDAAAQAKTPAWIRLRGGEERTGKGTSRNRIGDVSVCMSSFVEQTDHMVCRGGTYPGGAMPAGTVTLRLTYQIRKPNLTRTSHSLSGDQFDTKTASFPLSFPGGEACNDGTAVFDFWERRIASRWPDFLAQLDQGDFGAAIRSQILDVTRNEPASRLIGWETALRHYETGDPTLTRLGRRLDGALLINSMLAELAYPQFFPMSGLPLLLNGQVTVRVPDTEVLSAIIACFDDLGDPVCDNAALRERATRVSRSGFSGAFPKDAELLDQVLYSGSGQARKIAPGLLEPQSFPKLDLAVLRLDALLARPTSIPQPQPHRWRIALAAFVFIAFLGVVGWSQRTRFFPR